MPNGKLFIISGKDNSEEKLSNRKDRVAIALVDPDSSYKNGFHLLSILCSCGLALSIFTLIPRHNSILEPSYWYEIIFPAGFMLIFWTVALALDFFVLTEKDVLITIQLFFKNFLASLLTWNTIFFLCHMIWTTVLEYNHPMPLFGSICYCITTIVSYASLPILMPAKFSEEDGFKVKMKNFILYRMLWFEIPIIISILKHIFESLQNTSAQCVIALLIPISKRFTIWTFSKMMHRLVETENERANLTLTVTVNLSYSLFAVTSLVGARSETAFCVLVVDILMQLKMTYQIVKLHKQVMVDGHENSKMKQRNAIMKLLLAELCEGVVPLAYAIGFSMAYYGPNAELIGNVRNGYWQYKPVEDVSRTFLLMFGLFAVDFVSLSLNWRILWNYCDIDLFKKFCIVMKKFWHILAIKLVSNIYIFFVYNDVNFGNDITHQFCWITDDRNCSTIANSTEG